mmetsp:Transcript_13354/g.27132  ORF Transcript_13354/g.27132 Transcript_13354/m.27132 type:complete len:99 (-) Transcript_13354:706-1002(-)
MELECRVSEATDGWRFVWNHGGMGSKLAIQIGDEVNSQNRMLNDMGTQFENAGDLIGTTMRRLNEMIGSDASSKQILYLVAFMVFMVILVYFLFHGNN